MKLILLTLLGAAHAFLRGGGGGATCAADGGSQRLHRNHRRERQRARAPHPVLDAPTTNPTVLASRAVVR